MQGKLMTKYIAAVSLLVAAMSAQNSPSPNKGRHLSIPAISREANGAIVSIVMSDRDGHPIAQGSGFVVSQNGRVVTNYHVIRNGASAVIKLPTGSFFAVDGVLAFDKDHDVAVIKARGGNFQTVALGDSDRLQVGEEVVAIGSPLSLESTVSNGILSGIRSDDGRRLLQITAPISHGSSGGPLFNLAGEVVGITTAALVGGENLNFAVPINDVKKLLALPATHALVAFPDEPEAAAVAPKASAPTDGSPSLEETGENACNQQIAQISRSYPMIMGGYNRRKERCYVFFDAIPELDTTAPQSLRTIASNVKTFAGDSIDIFLIFDVTGVSFQNARLSADYIRVGNTLGECRVEKETCNSRERFSLLVKQNAGN